MQLSKRPTPNLLNLWLQRSLSIFVLICLALPWMTVRAQGQAFADLSTPDTSQFPAISMLMNAYDGGGNFISGLSSQTVTILENGQTITPDSVDLYQIPLYLTIAVNSGPALAVRDSLGNSRYDKAAAALSSWVGVQPSNSVDDFSLAWNGGVVNTHNAPAAWNTLFQAFDPAPRTSTPGLSALSFALDVAQQKTDTPGVKKAILLISPHLDKQSVATVDQLSQRAIQAGVRVYVWLIDSNDYLDHVGALALRDLAAATGGQYFQFTGEESFPDLQSWFAPLRSIYGLKYTSKIIQAGTQTLSVQVHSSDGNTATSSAVSFLVDVQPPNPVLLSPPIQIVRQNPDAQFEVDKFLPAEQEIQILVEFPDGHIRPLTRTALLVDGQVVDENTSPPFDRFTWDLRSFQVTAQHELQVEASDSLGLSRTSAVVPVQIVIIEPPGGIFGLLLRNSMALVIAAVVLAGFVLLFVLLLGGQLHIPTFKKARETRKRQLDPVTQPVPAAIEPPSTPRNNPFPWLRRKAGAPPAYFARLAADGSPQPGDPIGLAAQEMTFGTDPTQALVVLDHPSISSLHARLRRDEQGHFTLYDQNSIAGTWVNYDAIPQDGCLLKHGDVVHFGEMTYRFVLTKPPVKTKPVITPITEK